MTRPIVVTERLAALHACGLTDTPAEPHLDAIVGEAAAGLGTSGSTITLVDGRRQWFKAKIGVAHDGSPIADSICAHVVRSGRSMVVGDAAADPRFAAMRGVGGDGGVRFYAGVPLTLRDGLRVGTLCVLDPIPRAGIDAEDMATLERLARRTVAAFEASRAMAQAIDAGLVRTDPAAPGDPAWIDRAAAWLEQASAALDRVGASAPAAHLEQVIAMVERLRLAPSRREAT